MGTAGRSRRRGARGIPAAPGASLHSPCWWRRPPGPRDGEPVAGGETGTVGGTGPLTANPPPQRGSGSGRSSLFPRPPLPLRLRGGGSAEGSCPGGLPERKNGTSGRAGTSVHPDSCQVELPSSDERTSKKRGPPRRRVRRGPLSAGVVGWSQADASSPGPCPNPLVHLKREAEWCGVCSTASGGCQEEKRREGARGTRGPGDEGHPACWSFSPGAAGEPAPAASLCRGVPPAVRFEAPSGTCVGSWLLRRGPIGARTGGPASLRSRQDGLEVGGRGASGARR